MPRSFSDALVVIVDGEERPGIIAYGVSTPDTAAGSFPSDAWPAGTSCIELALTGPGWRVLLWEIELPTWPTDEAWTGAVRRTLSAHIEAGCPVAWVGAEGWPFSDPPYLLDPGVMSGSVLAWMTRDRFACDFDPDDEVSVLVDDPTLRMLRSRAAGLADAGLDAAIWNRAALTPLAEDARPGDVALHHALAFHSVAMNGGLAHAFDVHGWGARAAVDGWDFLGRREVADLLRRALELLGDMPADRDERQEFFATGWSEDLAEELERFDLQYIDDVIFDAFCAHLARRPEDFAPL